MQRCDAFCPYLTFVYGIATTSRTKVFVWAIWGSGGVVVVGGGGIGWGVVGGGGGPEGGGVVGICTDRLVSVVCMLDNMRIPRHCTRSSHTATQTNSTPNTRKRICKDRLVSVVCMLDNMRIPRHCTRSSHTATQTNSTPNTRKRTLQALGPEYIGKSTAPCGTHSRPALLCNCNTLLHRRVRTECNQHSPEPSRAGRVNAYLSEAGNVTPSSDVSSLSVRNRTLRDSNWCVNTHATVPAETSGDERTHICGMFNERISQGISQGVPL